MVEIWQKMQEVAPSLEGRVGAIESKANELERPIDKEQMKLELENWMRNPEARGNTEEAARKILQAFDENSKRLDLTNLNLTLLPSKAIGALTNLSRLNLSNNSLTSFSVENNFFPSLIELNLDKNRLTSFSIKKGAFPKLQKLNLFGNALTNFPAEMGFFPNLSMGKSTFRNKVFHRQSDDLYALHRRHSKLELGCWGLFPFRLESRLHL